MINKQKQGKANRAAGKKFEKEVEAHLESHGWIVVKFNKQVDIENNKLITARGQFNPFFKRIVGEGSGFPDFLCLNVATKGRELWEVQLVESKLNGYLNPEERKKCEWIEEHLGIKIYVASRLKVGRRNSINYIKFIK